MLNSRFNSLPYFLEEFWCHSKKFNVFSGPPGQVPGGLSRVISIYGVAWLTCLLS